MMLASFLIAAAAAAPLPPTTRGEPPAPAAPAAVSAAPLVGLPSTGFLSAGDLGTRCRATSAVPVSYCFAYVAAVHDTVRAYETWLRMREFCTPSRVSQADLRRAFVDYLDRHPTAGSGEAASVIVVAFKDRYACGRPAEDSAPPAASPRPQP